jgi:RNA polymerase sigma factor FliA
MSPRPPARAGRDSEDARQTMLARHLGLVYHVARQLSRTCAKDTELDELVSAGTLGLIEAFDKFDASRGLAFSTFAAPRIRGAMLDELRRQDRVPRSVRRRARAMHGVTESLTHRLGRAPEPSEVADGLGIDVGTLWRWQADGESAHHVSLDRAAPESSDVRLPVEFLASSGIDIDDELTRQQEIGHLRDAIMELSKQERLVLSLYYFEELRLAEVARILSVSESRVSQIRAKAVTRLKTKLQALRAAVV